MLNAVPYSTQYRIVGRYVRILTNIDQILTKNTKNDKNMSFFKRACQKQKKTPAALVSVATCVGVTNIDQILTNIDKYCIIKYYYYWISHLLQLIISNFAYLLFLLFNGGILNFVQASAGPGTKDQGPRSCWAWASGSRSSLVLGP